MFVKETRNVNKKLRFRGDIIVDLTKQRNIFYILVELLPNNLSKILKILYFELFLS